MKKLFFLLAICLLSHQAPWAQNPRAIDSLLAELPKSAEDTIKVRLFGELSFEYVNVNTDEGLKHGIQALALAEQLQWEKGVATAKKTSGGTIGGKAISRMRCNSTSNRWGCGRN